MSVPFEVGEVRLRCQVLFKADDRNSLSNLIKKKEIFLIKNHKTFLSFGQNAYFVLRERLDNPFKY